LLFPCLVSSQEGGLSFVCPSCGTREPAPNPWALARLQQAGRCQGCRARDTLERRPELAPLFLAFWSRTGFPASASWLASVPEGGGAH